MDGPGSVDRFVSGGSIVKRLLFAVAVACLFAVNALAADPPATATPAPVPGTVLAPTAPNVMSTTGMNSTRRFGLFSRLRNRTSGTTYSTPTSGIIVAPPAPATTAPGVVPSPMPMPGKAAEAAVTGSGVVTASGTVVNGVTTTGSMMMPMATTTTTRTRVGLLNRLRMRRGM